MSEQKGTATPLEIFKQRQGGASEELLAQVKARNKRKSAIKKALKNGPMTVPELAEATELDPAEVLWSLTAMRKYGFAVEDGVDGDYPRYALPEKEVKR
jgi:predicted transcriptional regulator